MIHLFLICVISTCLHDQVAYTCNCDVGCTRNELERCKSCKAGWYGPYCQKKNVALHGKATQQGTYLGHPAYLAVDGNTSTSNVDEMFNCSHTDERNNSWWSAQLGDNGVNQIRYMKIFNRQEHPLIKMRRKGMEILIDGKRCKKWPDSEAPETIEDVTCNNTLMGKNLTIQVLGPYYSVCEVQVFICSDGWFGKDCDMRCKCHHPNDVCDKVTGKCKLGCQAGYMGDDCQTHCKDGRYGQDCSERCGHCANNGSCNKTTGYCPSGCEAGWIQERCDRDSSTKWHVLPMALSALGTSLFVNLLVAGLLLCLLRQGRLLWVRKSTEEAGQVSRDHVQMSNVTRQPEHIYEAPTRSSNTSAEDNPYDVIQHKVYQNI